MTSPKQTYLRGYTIYTISHIVKPTIYQIVSRLRGKKIIDNLQYYTGVYIPKPLGYKLCLRLTYGRIKGYKLPVFVGGIHHIAIYYGKVSHPCTG